jgi:hypothetical protein
MRVTNLQDLPINDYLRDDILLNVTNSSPSYANIVNYMVTGYIPPGAEKKKLIHDSKKHMWDDSCLYSVCNDGLLRRCVPAPEGLQIIEKCHAGPYGGTMVSSARMQKYGRVDSFGQLCMKTLMNSFEDVICVKSTEELPHEMLCPCMTTCK